jgi:hypothetical protein
MYFIVSSYPGWSPLRRTGGGEIDSVARHELLAAAGDAFEPAGDEKLG